MGQKSNPFFMRLEQTNQHFQHCWFGDYNYTAQFIENCRIGAYVQNIYQQIGSGNPVILLKRGREQVETAFFMGGRLRSKRTGNRQRAGFPLRFADKPPLFRKSSLHFARQQGGASLEEEMSQWGKEALLIHRKSVLLQEYQGKLLCLLLYSTIASGEKTTLTVAPAQLSTGIFRGEENKRWEKRGVFPTLRWQAPRVLGCSFKKNSSPLEGRAFPSSFLTSSIPTTQRSVGRNVLESSISRQLQVRCKLHFVKCPSPHQKALFLAEQLVRSLQERVAFRHLKHRLIREISKNNSVKGVRITCSGRVAARSKKAQKARRESIQWGQTSLHVFSELVHFAQSSANTTFGKVGVKVWICYRA